MCGYVEQIRLTRAGAAARSGRRCGSIGLALRLDRAGARASLFSALGARSAVPGVGVRAAA